MRIVLLALFSLLISPLFAQADSSVVLSDEEVYTVVEEMPRFPGCEHLASKQEKEDCAFNKLMEYLASIEYPELAKNNGIEGKVFVQFVVEKDGSISNVTVPMGADKILNDAAIAHVGAMPNWVPAYHHGAPARVQYAVPMNFRLSTPSYLQPKN